MPWKKLFNDPVLAKRHLYYIKSANQARFRKEEWQLTEEQWNKIWTLDRFHKLGRSSDDLCLTRITSEGPWSWDNVMVISRSLHLRIKNRKYWNLPYEHYYQQAEWIA